MNPPSCHPIDAANRLRQAGRASECLRLLEPITADQNHACFFDALFLTADVHVEQGNYSTAFEIYNEILKRRPSDIAYNNRALCLWELNRRDEALLDYEKALSLNPGNQAARRAAGELSLELKQPQKAHDHFAAGISHDPTDATLFAGLGMACFEMERWSDAYKNFLQAIKLDPDNAIARKGIKHTEKWFDLDDNGTPPAG